MRCVNLQGTSKRMKKTFIIKNKSPISFEFKSNCVHLSPALSILIEVH